MVQMTLSKKDFLKKNKKIKILYILNELVFFSINIYLFYLFFMNTSIYSILSIIYSIFFFIMFFLKYDNLIGKSNIKLFNIINPFSFFSHKLFKILFYDKYKKNKNIKEFNYDLDLNKNIYFYTEVEIKTNKDKDYLSALYYWSQVEKLTNEIEKKEIASSQILKINEKIKNFNLKLKIYENSKDRKNIKNILKENKVEGNEVASKKIKLIDI